MRRGGAVNPAWKLGPDMRLGRLTVQEVRDPAVNRWLRTAELHSHDRVPMLRPLRDVTLLHLGGDYMILSGYEHRYVIGSDHPALVGQAWAVHQITEARYHEWRTAELAQGHDPTAVPQPHG